MCVCFSTRIFSVLVLSSRHWSENNPQIMRGQSRGLIRTLIRVNAAKPAAESAVDILILKLTRLYTFITMYLFLCSRKKSMVQVLFLHRPGAKINTRINFLNVLIAFKTKLKYLLVSSISIFHLNTIQNWLGNWSSFWRWLTKKRQKAPNMNYISVMALSMSSII